MECNKEEALRAKEMAEVKFKAKDIVAAKKLAVKAQNLFPSLEGIEQMIGTLDVYLAAEVKINGENDWYAILRVNASADEETLKKHYRKLALQLHPDKNKTVGAEGAFKLISEAWSVLSDSTRKTAYDRSRINNGFFSEASRKDKSQPDSFAGNGFFEFGHSKRSSKGARKSKKNVPPTQPSNLNTFWTSCNRCRMQYEYLRIYLNQNLLCPNCNQAFLAVEIGIPASVANSSASWTAKQCQPNVNHESVTKNGYASSFSASSFPRTRFSGFQHGSNFDSYGSHNYQWEAYAGTDGTATTATPSVQTTDAFRRKQEKLRRKQEKMLAAAREEEACGNSYNSQKVTVNDTVNLSFGSNCYAYQHEESVSRSSRPSKRKISNDDASCDDFQEGESEKFTINGASEAKRVNDAFVDGQRARLTARQNSFNKEYFQINARQLIMEKVKASMLKKLDEWDYANQVKLKVKENVNQKQPEKLNGTVPVKDHINGFSDKQSHVDGLKSKAPCYGRDIKLEKSIDVADPDFYDFDKDRAEKAFGNEQVWATYDSEDGMPRLYAFIQKVISRKPFKVRMSFLTSKSNSELAPINWVASGFVKTCGNFRVGRYEVSDTVNIFSHKVAWEKGPRGVFRIVPKKGETWALYKNWSPDWNELTPDVEIHKYEMVEIVDDYDDENGVSVTPLLKVAGFKAVFHQHLDPKKIRRIPREEMFRFSHQVPSYLLTGEETNNSLKGCRELDPAATPLELLQIITELKDDMATEACDQPGNS